MSSLSASTLHPAHADAAHTKPTTAPTFSPSDSASDAAAAAAVGAASLASSAAGRAGHAVRTPLKRFSHAQIAEKVAERAGSITDYYRLLMSAAVKSDDAGVVFDSSSAGWKELVRRCEEADQQERDSRRSTQAQQKPSAAGGAAAASLHSSEGTEGRRGREEDRSSRRRSISPLPSGSPSSTASPSPSQPSSSVAPLLLPASASAFFSKVSSIISSRPATAADAQQHSAEPAAEESLAANGGRQHSRRPASSRSAAGGHARHSSDVAAHFPPVASPALSRPASSHTMRPDRHAQERKARRVTAHPPSQAAQQPQQQAPPSLSPAAAAAAADAEAESSPSAASPAADGAGVRQVRLVRSAAHRTSGDRIRRSAGRELKDGSYVAADLQYEERLLAELSGAVTDAAVIADWRERRQREMERETERKRKEEAEERQRVAAGGRRRRKLVIPPTPVIQHAGAAVAELDYMQLLMTQLQQPADDDVDWTLVSRLAAVTGIPARHRKRLWTRLLRLKEPEAQDEQEDDDRQDDHSSISGTNNNSEEKTEEDAASAASPDAATASQSLVAEVAEAASESQRVSPSTFFSPLTVEAALPASSLSAASAASPSSGSSSSLSSPKLDLINQRVIRVDIERTLPHLQSMRRPDVRHDMEVLLTRYCKQQRISYKQGMNYLLAPFFFLQPLPLSRGGRHELSSLYSGFISALLPNTFSDEEFGSLQCLFLLFRHLLLYHDPQLCLHLDQAEMGPELYASSWFLTLYANRCRLEVALYLWDLLLLEADAGDPLLHYFVSLALLIANRAAILREAEVSLPELLSKLSINSRKDALTLLQRAKRLYRHNTSRGCMQRLHDITAAKISIDSPAYSELAGWSCLQLSAEELIANLLPAAAPQVHSAAALKFFVLDCRPAERYESGHLPQSLHLDPSLLEERRADELERRMEGVTAMRGCHFALLADSSSAELEADGGSPLPSAALSFLSLLLRRGIKYLSLISGGYSACHACILRLERSSELIDHRPDDCLECNGKTAVRREKRTLLSSMRKIGSAMIARLDTTPQTAEQTQQAYYHFTPQHKAEHLPDAVALLPTTAQLRLLMTALRDRQCDDGVFADVVERLTAILVGSSMDRLELRERHVGTAAGGLYSGVESAYPVCSLSLDSSAERLLASALRPYSSLIRVYTGRAAFQQYAQQLQPPQPAQQPPTAATPAASRVLVAVDVPEPLAEYQLLLLVPVLNNHNYPELLSLVTHLLACGSDLSYMAVLSLSSARSALWSVSSVYPSLSLLTAAVDEVRNGQLVPGISNLEQRWAKHRDAAPANSAHTAPAAVEEEEEAEQ